jgi:predicted dithiol-disulfide oxidoreductase (DUF899 family)
MAASGELVPAEELAKTNQAHFPNESAEYRRARNALLVKEIELRRRIEEVSALRRQLPPGGEVAKEYRFVGEDGPVALPDLFAGRDTLILYNYMFGPQRQNPCPSCTSYMATWDGKMADIEQRVSFVMVARSSIARLVAAKQARGWTHLKLVSDSSGDFTRDYVSANDDDIPGYTVFTRRDGVIRHFWSGEMSGAMADPGQDPRGAPDPDPLWSLLDTTPEGRGSDWYPKLSYPPRS